MAQDKISIVRTLEKMKDGRNNHHISLIQKAVERAGAYWQVDNAIEDQQMGWPDNSYEWGVYHRLYPIVKDLWQKYHGRM